MEAMIHVVCTTKGRPSLDLLVKSFLAQDLLPSDHLTIIGDGWHSKQAEAYRGPQVTFYSAMKAPYYGHEHVWHEFLKTNSGWYTAMGDDDMYCPDAFSSIRPHLSSTEILVTGYWGWYGNRVEDKIYGKESKKELVCLQQTYTPAHLKWPDFSNISDAEAFRRIQEAGEFPIKREYGIQPFVFRAPLAAQDKSRWELLRLHKVVPWSPEFQTWRT